MAGCQQIEVSFESFLCTHFDNRKTRDELRAFHSEKRIGNSSFGLSAFVFPFGGPLSAQPSIELRSTRSARYLQRCSGLWPTQDQRASATGAWRRLLPCAGTLGEVLAATASRQLYKAAVRKKFRANSLSAAYVLSTAYVGFVAAVAVAG